MSLYLTVAQNLVQIKTPPYITGQCDGCVCKLRLLHVIKVLLCVKFMLFRFIFALNVIKQVYYVFIFCDANSVGRLGNSEYISNIHESAKFRTEALRPTRPLKGINKGSIRNSLT